MNNTNLYISFTESIWNISELVFNFPAQGRLLFRQLQTTVLYIWISRSISTFSMKNYIYLSGWHISISSCLVGSYLCSCWIRSISIGLHGSYSHKGVLSDVNLCPKGLYLVEEMKNEQWMGQIKIEMATIISGWY